MVVNICVTLLLSFVFIKLLIVNAHKLHLLDIPNERSHHCSVIPRGAGIGFVGAIFIGLLFYDAHLFFEYWYIFFSILMVFGIGVLDDIYDTPPKAKFLVIFAAVTLLWLNGLSIDSLGTWFGIDVKLWWFSLPFTMFALAGFTNALNLIDGLDGLAGMTSIVILSMFAYIGYIHQDLLMINLSLFTIASLVGFLFLNYNPSKVFMGDSGSLTLGFIISILAMLSIQYVHPVTILYIAAIPILDTLVVMVRRIRRGRSPFSPDQTHLHHILVKFIGNKDENGKVINGTKRSVWFLVSLQALFSGVGLMISESISKHETILPLLALFGFIVVFLLVYIIFTSMKKRMNTSDEKG
jgi:UDP-GlcNAc:undecaprenyl-phosphate GlcNAc-1-phosphate transferase